MFRAFEKTETYSGFVSLISKPIICRCIAELLLFCRGFYLVVNDRECEVGRHKVLGHVVVPFYDTLPAEGKLASFLLICLWIYLL